MRIQDRRQQALEAGQLFEVATAVGGVPATYGVCQLLNPVGSGKRLELLSTKVNGYSTAIYAQLMRYDTAFGVAAVNPKNNFLGGAASVAEVRSTNIGALVGTIHATVYAGLLAIDFGTYILDPGKGVYILSDINQTQTTFFSYWEHAL